ncbi:hypothetical protein TPY_0879 [Sulfobacillus acidophilus TPY]|nr:hypothetical protein TPY_0879 [Sulfobacillus acidophilus TPY]
MLDSSDVMVARNKIAPSPLTHPANASLPSIISFRTQSML